MCVLKEVTFSETIRVFNFLGHFYNLFVLRKQHHLRGSHDGAFERNFNCFLDSFFIWLLVFLKIYLLFI